ncbi:MAG: hypothetical protein K6G18_12205 [Treponema sp.]|nr:hypothetical protein [Treponema sp.]
MAETKAKTSKTTRAVKKSPKTKETESSVGKTSKELLDKGLEASKKWFESAKKAISEWGDEGVKQVEIVKLNSKMEKGYTALGRLVYAKLSKRGASVSASDEEISDVVKLLSDMARKVKKLGGSADGGSGKTSRKAAAKKPEDEVKALPSKTGSTKKKATGKKTDGTAEKTAVKTRKASSTAKTAAKKSSSKKTSDTKAAAKKTASKRSSSSSKKA